MEPDRGDPWKELRTVTLDSVAGGNLPPEAVLPGVRALDLWSDGVFGSLLFWVDAEVAQKSYGHLERGPSPIPALLGHVTVTRADGRWRPMGSSLGSIEQPWSDFLASVAPGLTRCGGGCHGRQDAGAWHKVCLTLVTAGPDVAVVRLRNQDGNVRDRPPGRHGFAILGITPEDPLTRAYGIGHDGEELPGEPITLWCSPYDTSSTR